MRKAHSIPERGKRTIYNHRRSRYHADGRLSRLTELAKKAVKGWRRPAAVLLRLAVILDFQPLIAVEGS